MRTSCRFDVRCRCMPCMQTDHIGDGVTCTTCCLRALSRADARTRFSTMDVAGRRLIRVRTPLERVLTHRSTTCFSTSAAGALPRGHRSCCPALSGVSRTILLTDSSALCGPYPPITKPTAISTASPGHGLPSACPPLRCSSATTVHANCLDIEHLICSSPSDAVFRLRVLHDSDCHPVIVWAQNWVSQGEHRIERAI